jgi:arylsulfatase A-like enzyme
MTLLVLGSVGLIAARPAEFGRPLAKGPDIILISLDATRADRLGADVTRGVTPNLDAFAARCEVFERAYTQEPWTLTSHMSMLTGLYPDAHGLDFGRALPARVWTLAERLREAGYRTAASVRDCFLLSPRFGYAAGFDRYQEDARDAQSRCRAAADWLLARDRPSFLFLHLYDPHSDSGALPYDAPSNWLPQQTPRREFVEWAGGRGASEALRQVNEGQLALPESLALWIPRLYDAGLRATDAALGEFFQRLEAADRLRSAWVIVLADHGEALGERGHWMHEELMQATLHIPLLVHRPQDLRAGERRPELAETVDLMPTLLEAAGLPREAISQGESLSAPFERRFASHRSGPRYAITTFDDWRLEYEFGDGGFLCPSSIRGSNRSRACIAPMPRWRRAGAAQQCRSTRRTKNCCDRWATSIERGALARRGRHR